MSTVHNVCVFVHTFSTTVIVSCMFRAVRQVCEGAVVIALDYVDGESNHCNYQVIIEQVTNCLVEGTHWDTISLCSMKMGLYWTLSTVPVHVFYCCSRYSKKKCKECLATRSTVTLSFSFSFSFIVVSLVKCQSKTSNRPPEEKGSFVSFLFGLQQVLLLCTLPSTGALVP